MSDRNGNICSVPMSPPAGTSIAAPPAASFRGRGAAYSGWMATARSGSLSCAPRAPSSSVRTPCPMMSALSLGEGPYGGKLPGALATGHYRGRVLRRRRRHLLHGARDARGMLDRLRASRRGRHSSRGGRRPQSEKLVRLLIAELDLKGQRSPSSEPGRRQGLGGCCCCSSSTLSKSPGRPWLPSSRADVEPGAFHSFVAWQTAPCKSRLWST